MDMIIKLKYKKINRGIWIWSWRTVVQEMLLYHSKADGSLVVKGRQFYIRIYGPQVPNEGI